jgi:hypothetical protein
MPDRGVIRPRVQVPARCPSPFPIRSNEAAALLEPPLKFKLGLEECTCIMPVASHSTSFSILT